MGQNKSFFITFLVIFIHIVLVVSRREKQALTYNDIHVAMSDFRGQNKSVKTLSARHIGFPTVMFLFVRFMLPTSYCTQCTVLYNNLFQPAFLYNL